MQKVRFTRLTYLFPVFFFIGHIIVPGVVEASPRTFFKEDLKEIFCNLGIRNIKTDVITEYIHVDNLEHIKTVFDKFRAKSIGSFAIFGDVDSFSAARSSKAMINQSADQISKYATGSECESIGNCDHRILLWGGILIGVIATIIFYDVILRFFD